MFQKQNSSVTVQTETIIRIILLIALAVLAFMFLSDIRHQLQLIAISIFLAIALNPAVTWITLRLRSKSRVRATGVAYLTVLTLLAGLLTLIVPPLVKQTVDFIETVPATINNLQNQDSALGNFVRTNELDEQLETLSNDIRDRIGSDFTQPVFNTANRVFGTLISLVTILVLTFMMLVEGPVWFKRLMRAQPADKREHRKNVLKKMYRVVTAYVNGQVLIAAIGASLALVAIFIAGTIFNAPINAVAMAAIIFMFGLIPLVGNTIGASIVVLVALFSSLPMAIALAIYFLLYQQIENVTLQPYIQAKSNQLTPLIVFTAAIIGAGFGGILGAFAAIPIAGCIKVIVEDKFPHLFPSLDVVQNKSRDER